MTVFNSHNLMMGKNRQGFMTQKTVINKTIKKSLLTLDSLTVLNRHKLTFMMVFSHHKTPFSSSAGPTGSDVTAPYG